MGVSWALNEFKKKNGIAPEHYVLNKHPFCALFYYDADAEAPDFVLESQFLCCIPVVFKLHFLGLQDPAVMNQRLGERREEQVKEKV